MNPVAQHLTGWTQDEARGQPLRRLFRIVNERTRLEVESPVDRVLREGRVVGLANHTVLVKKSGEEVPIADSGAPIRDEQARIVGVVLVFRDASADRRADRQRAFLVEIGDALASPLLDHKEMLARVAKMVVPEFADWCAVDAAEDGAKAPADTTRGGPNVIRTGRSELYPDVPDDLLARIAKSPQRLEALGSVRARSAVIVPIADGKQVRAAMTLVLRDSGRRYTEADVPFFEEVGRRAGVAIENARLYRSEQRAREAADAANHMKDDFLATVSHELRTPLNTIVGWAKMLDGIWLDETRRARAIDTIQRSAGAMARLVEDLLDLSRIVSGKLRLDVASLDVVPLVEAAIESVRPAAEAKEIRLRHPTPSGEGLLLGDATRLQQVVWNLLSNAVKFTPRGGEVAVAVNHDPDGAIEISVQDSGKGVSPEFLPHVFEPFRQAEGGLSRSTGGLGLGLSITKHIVELHGGRIEASSDGEGKGARFTVRLPLIATQPAARRSTRAPPPASVPPPAVRLDGLTVLTVEDDPDSRDLLRALLEDAGARVIGAESVPEAMKAIESQVPDVLISDIGMPGESGYDLIRRVRALPPGEGGDVPAAAMTAYARAEDRQKVLAAGYMMHVPKPLDPSEVVMVVAVLARYQPRGQPMVHASK